MDDWIDGGVIIIENIWELKNLLEQIYTVRTLKGRKQRFILNQNNKIDFI